VVSAAGLLAATIAALVVQRGLELRIAKRNEASARREGARELGARHYPLFFLLHGGWLLAWPVEAWARGLALVPSWPAWLVLFGAAQLLRYWAITTLGTRWNTRVLVMPGLAPIRRGPYRWLAHPNYVAVVVELAAVPMIFGATTTAIVASLLNLVLLFGVRIPCETAALRWAAEAAPGPASPAAPTDRTAARSR
jgi:methyltransferase